MDISRSVAVAVALTALTVPAVAHQDHQDHQPGTHMSGMEHMMGMHEMTATVDAIDAKTGIVDVTTGGMKLKMHFPPTALASLKVGDKITLHMGFTKP